MTHTIELPSGTWVVECLGSEWKIIDQLGTVRGRYDSVARMALVMAGLFDRCDQLNAEIRRLEKVADDLAERPTHEPKKASP